MRAAVMLAASALVLKLRMRGGVATFRGRFNRSASRPAIAINTPPISTKGCRYQGLGSTVCGGVATGGFTGAWTAGFGGTPAVGAGALEVLLAAAVLAEELAEA